jgi:hypothetical protein
MDINTTNIILALIALVAIVAVGITVAVRIVIRNRSNRTKTKQSDNVVFGDQAGRDIKK